jgi:hypothetical protein
MRFIVLLPSRTTFVAPSSKWMTDFDALESGICRKLLECNEEDAVEAMVRRLLYR